MGYSFDFPKLWFLQAFVLPSQPNSRFPSPTCANAEESRASAQIRAPGRRGGEGGGAEGGRGRRGAGRRRRAAAGVQLAEPARAKSLLRRELVRCRTRGFFSPAGSGWGKWRWLGRRPGSSWWAGVRSICGKLLAWMSVRRSCSKTGSGPRREGAL